MKNYIETFTDALAVSTPLFQIKSFDNTASAQAVITSVDEPKTAFLSWDSIRGLVPVNEAGQNECATLCQLAGVEAGATVDLPITLGVLQHASENVLTFIHNAHMVWDADSKVIQAILNLRNDYKNNSNAVILLDSVGDLLPKELQQDVLVLEAPLPTRAELEAVVLKTYADAGQNKKYPACKTPPTKQVLDAAVDALIGLPYFPADQATAMELNKVKGILDIDAMWSRKKDIVSMNPGLSYQPNLPKLKDKFGVEAATDFGVKLLSGSYSPTLILRMDEIQRQFAGNESDSSGTKGNMMGEFLTWVEERQIICSMYVGVQGTSKSWLPYCLGGEFNKQVINMSMPAMEDKHVGVSSGNLRTNIRVLDAISGAKIWLIASANKMDGLPPELLNRFQVGGIYFFDVPSDEERLGIMKLKIAAHGLDANQILPDMTSWTGRDINSCAYKAKVLGCSLVEAGKHIVPLLVSHGEAIESLRESATGRFLSASHAGVYKYAKAPVTHTPTVKSDVRKFR